MNLHNSGMKEVEPIWHCDDGKSKKSPLSPWEWFHNCWPKPCRALGGCIPSSSPPGSISKLDPSIPTKDPEFVDVSTFFEAKERDEEEHGRRLPSTTAMVTRSKWLPHPSYTVEVWNALVSVLCFNALLHFFVKHPPRKQNQ